MIKVCVNILLFGLLIASCAINNNGFFLSPNVNLHTDSLITSVGNAKVVSNTNCEGYFARITHTNGRYIDIFYPTKATDTFNFDFGIVIKNLEANYPTNWPFYYAPLGIFNIDSIIVDNTSNLWQSRLTFLSLINEDLINWNTINISRFKIKYVYVAGLKGIILNAPVQQINLYNSMDHIDDGPDQYRKTPYYQFLDTIPFKFLIPDV